MTTSHETPPSIKSRLAHEFKTYAAISFYLFVCFSVVLIYEASQAATAEVTSLTLGVAIVKALVLGKFVLIGELFKPGTRVSARTLTHRVAWRSLGLLAVLVVFKLLEEVIVGLVHGQSVATIANELADMSWLSLLGPVLMMLLILIPLVTAIELDRVLGGEGLKGLMFRQE